MAGLAAWWSLRGIISSTPVRVWMSVAYALLPAVLGATAAGRLGTAAAAVFLPVTMRAFVRVLPVNVRGLPETQRTNPVVDRAAPGRAHRLRAGAVADRPGGRAGDAGVVAAAWARPAGDCERKLRFCG